MDRFDVAVIGAGAAGMMCAAVAGQRGRRVVLIDHAEKLAEKIRISGGGRCNFTNLYTQPANFVSANPKFCHSILSRYPPRAFIELVRAYRIGFHEKHKGQLFCDESSEAIIGMLQSECERGKVAWRMPCSIDGITRNEEGFVLASSIGEIKAGRLVIASGGLSIPKIGATDFGYRIARQFGLKVVEPRPALVPLTFESTYWQAFSELAGVSMEAGIGLARGAQRSVPPFLEDLLVTHRGLSGPGILQISTYWNPGEALEIDLAPGRDLGAELVAAKASSRQTLVNVLAQWFARNFAAGWLRARPQWVALADRKLAEVRDRDLLEIGRSLNHWSVTPNGTEGFKKAEVTRGGVDTDFLSQSTLEATTEPGLHFIGEAVDVTGWLGGYNFQWAWASGAAVGRAV